MAILNIDHKFFEDILNPNNGDGTKGLIYKKIIDEGHISPDELLVIGNSFESDISPALKLGAEGKVICKANFEFKDFFDKNCNLKK